MVSKVVRGLRNIKKPPCMAVVALGNFDGVHLGHQAVIGKAVDYARKIGGCSIAYTFEPHPIKILKPEKEFRLLSTFKRKISLISDLGVDMVICADFTRDFARINPGSFARMLKDSLDLCRVVVGDDYSFGDQGAGKVDMLLRLGSDLGFSVDIVSSLSHGSERISSSRIRLLLAKGNVAEAASLLGRYYLIDGKVVEGFGRGKGLGFPTANLDTTYEIIPAVGVYAGYVRLASESLSRDAVINVGYNPTFNRNKLIVEPHIIDFDGSIRGSDIEVEFVDRIRDEIRFESVDQLKSQIGGDIVVAQEILFSKKSLYTK